MLLSPLSPFFLLLHAAISLVPRSLVLRLAGAFLALFGTLTVLLRHSTYLWISHIIVDHPLLSILYPPLLSDPQLLLLLDPPRLLLRQPEAPNAHQTRGAERVQLDALSLPRGDRLLHLLRLRLALRALALPLSRLRVGKTALGPRVLSSGRCERRKQEVWNLRAAFAPAEIELNNAEISAARDALNAVKQMLREVGLSEKYDVEPRHSRGDGSGYEESLSSLFELRCVDSRSNEQSNRF